MMTKSIATTSPPPAHPTPFDDPQSHGLPWRRVLLRVAVLASPVAWASDLGLSYAFVRRMAVQGVRGPALVVAAISFAVIAVAGVHCLRCYRRLGDERPSPGSPTGTPLAARSDRTLALWGIVLAAYFALMVLGRTYPVLVLRPDELALVEAGTP